MMHRHVLEALETRTLLSAVILPAGQAALFDFDADGNHDGVLVNNGRSAIEYVYSGGSALDAVNITADDAKFTTNMQVGQIGDTDAADDFGLGKTKVGVDVRYRGQWYGAVAGGTSLTAGEIDEFTLGLGDLLSATTTEAGIGKLTVSDGDAYDVNSAAGIYKLFVEGALKGSLLAPGAIDTLSVERIDGAWMDVDGGIRKLAVDVIEGSAYIDGGSFEELSVGEIRGGATISAVDSIGKLTVGDLLEGSVIAGGNVGSIFADTLAGLGYGTSVTIGGGLQRLKANTISAGENGSLNVSIAGRLDRLQVGLLEGGTATGGGFAATTLSVVGGIGCFEAGLISGGVATGAGSFVMLNVYVDDLVDWNTGEVLSAGDIGYLRATGISGGVGTDGGEAMVSFNVSHDLVEARIGQMIGSGTVEPISDPSVFLTVGHDIVKFVANSISAGTADGEYAYASVWITANNDIRQLIAGQIDAGTAAGAYSSVEVYITAGRDIQSIVSTVFSGGVSLAEGAMAGVYVDAGRNIDFIGSQLISGTQAERRIADPTVQFVAGGDIGCVMAGQITGGTVTGGEDAEASVALWAKGEYVDENGVQSLGDIGAIYAGTIRGGTVDGAGALAFVDIHAAHDIGKLYADTISGGRTTNGGYAYVNILAEHDIVDLQAGTILGSENPGANWDPAVQIQAYNDIKSLMADRIIAGQAGVVNILAGIDADGNVSGEYDENGNLVAGSIESIIVGTISGAGGIVNIAAGGDIESLKACQINSVDGTVSIVAGGDITADVKRVRSWELQDGTTGVSFSAGGEVFDVRGTIRDQYVHEGGPVEFPDSVEPE